jgi:peptide/nickel transport system permease protein
MRWKRKKITGEEEWLSLRELSWRKFRRNRLAMAGVCALVLLTLAAVCAPLLTHYSYSAQDILQIRRPPSRAHLLGTDELGRDVLARLLYGGRVSILVGLASMGLQLVIGVVMGTVAGYFGGMADAVIMRIIDVIMCFPFFVIALSMAAIAGPGMKNIILIIGLLMWPNIARIVRAEVLSLKENDYILAARALGLRPADIILHQILPNVLSPILVAATLAIADGILSEASLSYLNLGVKLPQPSWGNMLVAAQNMSALQHEWWRWVPAGIMVVTTVLSINFVGDGLRDALDPRVKA